MAGLDRRLVRQALVLVGLAGLAVAAPAASAPTRELAGSTHQIQPSAKPAALTPFQSVDQPLTVRKTADSSSAVQSGTDGYTITITNPNSTAVTVNEITDALPAGFIYTPGSSSGVTTTNPMVAGSMLTWTGAFSLGPGATITLHFDVTVSGTPGTYSDVAGGAAFVSEPVTVIPTGPVAPVQDVSGPGPPPPTGRRRRRADTARAARNASAAVTSAQTSSALPLTTSKTADSPSRCRARPMVTRSRSRIPIKHRDRHFVHGFAAVGVHVHTWIDFRSDDSRSVDLRLEPDMVGRLPGHRRQLDLDSLRGHRVQHDGEATSTTRAAPRSSTRSSQSHRPVQSHRSPSIPLPVLGKEVNAKLVSGTVDFKTSKRSAICAAAPRSVSCRRAQRSTREGGRCS